MASDPPRKVLIIDDDLVVSTLVRDVLADEGYAVSVLNAFDEATLRTAVNKLEPDCVLLDSERSGVYGASWSAAAWAHRRDRPIPIVMFTASRAATQEATEASSDR